MGSLGVPLELRGPGNAVKGQTFPDDRRVLNMEFLANRMNRPVARTNR
jgi:hypothetical protein